MLLVGFLLVQEKVVGFEFNLGQPNIENKLNSFFFQNMQNMKNYPMQFGVNPCKVKKNMPESVSNLELVRWYLTSH